MTWAHSREGKCWRNPGDLELLLSNPEGRLLKEALCTPGVRCKQLKILPKKKIQTLKPYTGDHAQPSSQRAKEPSKISLRKQMW